MKNLFVDPLLFRKVLFLPKEIEVQEILVDNIRLELIVNQIQQDVLNLSKIILSFRDYVMHASLWLYASAVEKGKIEINQDNLAKLIPPPILKAQKKEKWIETIKETIGKLQTSIGGSLLKEE